MSKTIQKVNVQAAAAKRNEFLNLVSKDIHGIEKVHISIGNSKMGAIPSFSVLPIITCKNCIECSKYCYACKGCFNFNGNITNLAENTALVKADINRVYSEVNSFLNQSTTLYRYFRFNTAGDIFSIEYLELIVALAKANPLTRFLAFTKNYDLINSYLDSASLPENLTIIFSRWDNATIDNRHNLPVAVTNIPGSTVVPENSFHCNGDCANCLNCWNAQNGTYRHFDLH